MRLNSISNWRPFGSVATFFNNHSFPLTKVQKVAFLVLAVAISVPFVKRCAYYTWTILKSLFSNPIAENITGLSSPSFLSRAQNKYRVLSNSRIHDQTSWILTTLEVFKDAYIEEGCHSCVRWEGSSDVAYNFLKIDLEDGSSFFREDCLNNQTIHVEAVSFKLAIDALCPHQYSTLYSVCRSSQYQSLSDVDLNSFLIHLETIAFAMKDRYGSQISNSSSIQDRIHRIMQKLFIQKLEEIDPGLECLQNDEFATSTCQAAIQELLKDAEIQDKALIISSERVSFERVMTQNPKNFHDFVHISCFSVNDLTSKNAAEEPFITDEAFVLANFLKESSADIKMCPAFESFSHFFRKKYYNDFCSQLMRKNTLRDKKVPALVNPALSLTSISNNLNGDRFKNHLFASFKLQKTWVLPGSCVLAALMPEYGAKATSESKAKAKEIRQQIANTLRENVRNYFPFVTVVVDFSKLSEDTQKLLKTSNWVIAEDNTDESKEKAILKRCDDLESGTVFLMEPELVIVAQIFERPLWIYKQEARRFEVKNGLIQPHMIYGEGYGKEKAAHLLEHNGHYESLLPQFS